MPCWWGRLATTRSRPARAGSICDLLLHRIATAPAGEGAGDLGAALVELAKPSRRRSLVVVVSDFLGEATWHDPLRGLASRHDVICIEVVDPRELELPDVGVLALLDAETGAQREIRTSARLRARYAAAAAEQRASIAGAIRDAGADHLRLGTDRDWVLDIVRFVRQRSQRAALMRGARR